MPKANPQRFCRSDGLVTTSLFWIAAIRNGSGLEQSGLAEVFYVQESFLSLRSDVFIDRLLMLCSLLLGEGTAQSGFIGALMEVTSKWATYSDPYHSIHKGS